MTPIAGDDTMLAKSLAARFGRVCRWRKLYGPKVIVFSDYA